MNIGRSLIASMLTITLATPTFACTVDGKEGILPDNDMWIPVDTKSPTGLTKEEFDDVINKVTTIYAPEVARRGARLMIDRRWQDGTVNAQAFQKGRDWYLRMFGGMARHPMMTRDGFAVVICHELGHHLGGAPKKVAGGWASNEGQSDYFATLKCMRRVLNHEDNMGFLRGRQASTTLINSCKASWPSAADYAICVRSGLAGLSVAQVFQAMKRAAVAPSFANPDRQNVTATNNGHPQYQCRLDTFFQGAICKVDETVALSNTNDRAGVCHPANGHKVGNRPLCWYKSR